jgi:AcrR family transcriptional regulator
MVLATARRGVSASTHDTIDLAGSQPAWYYGAMGRTGRRPGPSTTRGAILEAARRRFAEAGYDGASIRAIAADAGVDPAVVLHFFGSKDGLFRAAVGWPFDPAAVAAQITAPGPDGIGARVARVFLGFWEDPTTRASLLALLRSAMTHEASAALLREFAVRHLFVQLTGLVGGPQGELRVNLAAAHLIGVAVLRYALRVEPIASASVDELVAWLTPPLTHYLGPESSDGAGGA